MFKRVFLPLILMVALAGPAAAETSGVYAGLKFLDSIQSTGKFSKGGDFNSLGMNEYSQNTVGGGIFVGYDFYPQNQVPVFWLCQEPSEPYPFLRYRQEQWHSRGNNHCCPA